MKNTLTFLFSLVKTNAILSRRLSVHGLDFSDFMIISYLNESREQKLRWIDLAEKLGLTASGITRMLLPLEKLGIIERSLDDADARARYASITPAGKNLPEDAHKYWNETGGYHARRVRSWTGKIYWIIRKN